MSASLVSLMLLFVTPPGAQAAQRAPAENDAYEAAFRNTSKKKDPRRG